MPFERDGYEFCVIKIKGQSFMLHQIRKMVGMVIALARGFATNENLELCWTANKVNTFYFINKDISIWFLT
jgi:tRNA pseudouridine38-40 synthase